MTVSRYRHGIAHHKMERATKAGGGRYILHVILRSGHPGYGWYGVTSDGELLCRSCILANYREIWDETVCENWDTGWRLVALTTSGELEDREYCAGCDRVLVED